MLRYVYAARALWQAEHGGFQRMADAIRSGDPAGFETAAASVRAAREAFEAATGHSGADDAGERAMRARKTSSGRGEGATD
jgi:hypothetical protein